MPADPNNRFRKMERLARLMDSQFSIPGTNIKFGLDALIGLIPGIGDVSTFFVSAIMVIVLAQNGASGFVLARMILNIILDAVIGSIPLIGDLFDVAFKANQANLRLMREHYQEGRHKGSAWKLIIPVLIIVLALIVAIGWVVYWVLTKLYQLVS